jgi:hypothetical protein
VDRKGLESCGGCEELPCSKLMRFCFGSIWSYQLPLVENLRRQKTVVLKNGRKSKQIFGEINGTSICGFGHRKNAKSD